MIGLRPEGPVQLPAQGIALGMGTPHQFSPERATQLGVPRMRYNLGCVSLSGLVGFGPVCCRSYSPRRTLLRLPDSRRAYTVLCVFHRPCCISFNLIDFSAQGAGQYVAVEFLQFLALHRTKYRRRVVQKTSLIVVL